MRAPRPSPGPQTPPRAGAGAAASAPAPAPRRVRRGRLSELDAVRHARESLQKSLTGSTPHLGVHIGLLGGRPQAVASTTLSYQSLPLGVECLHPLLRSFYASRHVALPRRRCRGARYPLIAACSCVVTPTGSLFPVAASSSNIPSRLCVTPRHITSQVLEALACARRRLLSPGADAPS